MLTKVFGYGSLLNPQSAGRTLGAPYRPEEIELAHLKGFTRQYDTKLSCPGVPDHFVSFLNVSRSGNPDDKVNGVLIPVNDEELEALKIREAGYDLIDVTKEIEPPQPEGVRVLTFSCPDCNRLKPEDKACILGPYVKIVEEGIRYYGEEFMKAFRRLTKPITLPIRDEEK